MRHILTVNFKSVSMSLLTLVLLTFSVGYVYHKPDSEFPYEGTDFDIRIRDEDRSNLPL